MVNYKEEAILFNSIFFEVPNLLHKARRRGLVVRVKIHVQEVVSSNPVPAVETIYHAPLIWIKSMKANIVEK